MFFWRTALDNDDDETRVHTSGVVASLERELLGSPLSPTLTSALPPPLLFPPILPPVHSL